MTIKEDAGKVLLFIYTQKIKGQNKPNVNHLLEATGWEGHRLENALDYCQEKGFLEIIKLLGSTNGIQNRIIKGLTAEGSDLIEQTEDKDEKRNFEVNFNLIINNEFNIDSIIKGEAKLF